MIVCVCEMKAGGCSTLTAVPQAAMWYQWFSLYECAFFSGWLLTGQHRWDSTIDLCIALWVWIKCVIQNRSRNWERVLPQQRKCRSTWNETRPAFSIWQGMWGCKCAQTHTPDLCTDKKDLCLRLDGRFSPLTQIKRKKESQGEKYVTHCKTWILEARNNCYVLMVDKTHAIYKPAMSSYCYQNLLQG